jgi:fructose-bisphosphate aldolase class II
MPLVNMKDMLHHAYAQGYAVGGFDLVSLDFLQAILGAAETSRSPVILSLAESHFEYYDFKLAMAATVAAAEVATVPVAIHLDHGASLDSAVQAINLGCNGVMVDASQQAFADNVATTKAVVDMARGCGVPVEGELGYVAGVEGEDAARHPGEVVYTSPEEAAAFVAATGVDFLAVSVGTVHGRMRGAPQLDFERLAHINAALQLPLVIHGGTGLDDEQFRRLIENGVAKINYYTALADAAGQCIRANVAADATCGYTGLLQGIQDAMGAEVARCMAVFGSAGQAEAALAACRAWEPVEHLIIYNVKGIDDTQVQAMMARGREVLGAIPGVRRVFTGEAVQDQAAYRFCWLVQFVQPEVIASYRDHPQHMAFANEWFRPVAGDRISIDYAAVARPAT